MDHQNDTQGINMFGVFKKIELIDGLLKQIDVLNNKLDMLSEENIELKKQIEEFKSLTEDIKAQNRPIPHIVEVVFDLQKDMDVIKKFQHAKMERWEKNKHLTENGKLRRYGRN